MNTISELSSTVVQAICESVLGGCEGFEQTPEGDGFVFDNPEGEGTIKPGKPGRVVSDGSLYTILNDEGWTVTLPDGRLATHTDLVTAINNAVEQGVPEPTMQAVVDTVEIERIDDAEGSAERGESCIGIRAKATVRVHLTSHPDGHALIVPITSGGLWGVEVASDEAYIQEIEEEQRADLAEILAAFGLEV